MKDSDCEKTIQTMGWADLRDMWDKIQKGSPTGWDSGKAFEYLVPRAFQWGSYEDARACGIEPIGVHAGQTFECGI